MRSSLEIFRLATGRSEVLLETDELIEAPNWDPGGGSLLVNGGGRLHRVALGAAPELAPVDTGFADRCNNDHGISPDGRLIAISHHDRPRRSTIYTLPAAGGAPRQVTTRNPVLLAWLVAGRRDARLLRPRDGRFDIYTIPVAGGEETRLTDVGHNDGPDYSPDGRRICSTPTAAGRCRSGGCAPDGSDLERMTEDGLSTGSRIRRPTAARCCSWPIRQEPPGIPGTRTWR